MSVTITGNPATSHGDPISFTAPADEDAATAASVKVAFQALADVLSALQGLLDTIYSASHTWLSSQAFTAGLTGSGGPMNGASVTGTGGAETKGGYFTSAAGGNSPDYPAIRAEGYQYSPAVRAVGGAISEGVYASSAGAAAAVKAAGTTLGLEATASTGWAVRATGNATNAPLYLVPMSGDPSSPSNGEIWFNLATNTLRVHINNANKTVTLT